VDRVSRQAGGANPDRARASLIFSPCLNDLPENTPSLSGFAGFSRHI